MWNSLVLKYIVADVLQNLVVVKTPVVLQIVDIVVLVSQWLVIFRNAWEEGVFQ